MLKESKSKRWPSGDYIDVATFAMTRDELEQRCRRTSKEGTEQGLGEWHGIGGELPSGALVAFIKYPNSPKPDDYVLKTDAGQNIDIVLKEVYVLLEISEEDLHWSRYGGAA